MKKLLMYVNSMNALGGIERVIANLSERFAQYYDVTILVKDSPISAYPLANNIKMDSIDTEIKMDMNSRIKRITNVFFNIFRSIRALRKYLNDNSYDVIYTATPSNVLELYYADKSIRKKIVASEHASYYAYNSVYKKIKEWLYPHLQAISVPTTMDTEIYKKLGYKVSYIPHITTYSSVHKNSLNSKRIINVGRLTSDKQQDMLLDIWKSVNEKIPDCDWKLQIIGSGEEEQNIRNKVNNLKLTNVELIGHTPKISEYYKDASLFVFTSKMEGFGMVLLEAMSYGVPCISFDCPSGPRDIVTNEKNGYLIDCYKEDLFSDMICKYILAPIEEKRKLSNGALETVQNWNNEAIMDKWVELFDKVAN